MKKHVWKLFFLLVIVCAAGVGVWELERTSVACTTITPSGASTISTGANEPVVAFASGAGGGSTVLVSTFNRVTDAGIFGWATSTGGSWTSGSIANLPDAGGVLMGNTGVAATGSIVAAVALLDTDGDPSNGNARVVVYTSVNSASSFINSQWVNDTGNCSGGRQDQPVVTFDNTVTPPRLWIGWRHRGSDLGHYGGCVRGGTVDPMTGVITWGAEPQTIDNMTGSTGQGGLNIVAGDGALTVAYMNNDDTIGGDTGFNCDDFGTKSVGWGVVQSFNDGVDWTSSHEVLTTNSFVWCIGSQDPTIDAAGVGLINKSFRDFSLARAPSGDLYLAVNDAKNTIRLLHGRSGNSNYKWRELCSNAAWNTPGTTCTTAFVTGAEESVAFPTLTVDGANRVALTYYEVNESLPDGGVVAPSTARLVMRASSTPLAPVPTWCSPVAVSSFLGTNNNLIGARMFGDYQGMTPFGDTATPSAGGCTTGQSFVPVWTDSFGSGVSKVNSSTVTITP